MQVAFAEVNDLESLDRHPALRSVVVETEHGVATSVAPAARFNGQERETKPVPALGAHTAALAHEFAAPLA